MNMQEFTDSGHMDAVEEWLESEIDATILEASILDQIYDARDKLFKDAGVKFDSEPNKNQVAISELSEDFQFEADQGIGVEESEKESAHRPYYIDENGNIFTVLSVSDGIKPFESHPSPSISDTSIPALSNVKPETDLGVDELFDDSKNKLLPQLHKVDHHIAIAEQWDIGHVEVDHGFGTEESGIKSDCVLSSTENVDTFPVLSVDDTKKPVCVKPETAIHEMSGQSSENASITDVLGKGEAELEVFPRNGTDGAQLLENPSKDIDVVDVESVGNASHISDDKLLDINSCVTDTTFPINVQDAEIQNSVSGQAEFLSPQNTAILETERVEVDDYPCNDIPGTDLAHGILNSEGEATTFHTDGPDTKNEEIIVIVANHEISSGIANSNASSVNVLSSEGDVSGSPIIGHEESIVASGKTSDADYIIEEEMAPVVKHFFLVKMPKFDDLIVQERARRATSLVDERTRRVDSLRFEIQKYKENSRADVIVYEALMSEAREIKRAVQSQRAEINSLNTVMSRVKNALAIQDIDNRVANIKHSIEHGTIPSDRENALTREIKQLNQLREYLSTNLGDLDELQLAINNRDQTERQLQSLKRELDGLKDSYMRAEALARAVEHRCRGELVKLKEAQAQLRAADIARLEAYKQMQSFNREMQEKNKQFNRYKADASVAYSNAAKGEIQALSNLCFDQVEDTMLLWNKNPQFRKEYVRCNMRSTVDRLGMLDGRSLGPDEKAVMLSNNVYLSIDVQPKWPKPTQPSHVDGACSGYIGTIGEEQLANKEELEDGEKAELLTEATLKEQRRLEEKSKALEALMRKKKIAEKAQTRAEIRAQKEALHKEKEREKRLRKKERRRSSTSETSDANSADIITRCSETTEIMNESDTTAPPAAKRICQKPSQSVKQSKPKVIPPSLRNKNRKKLHHWMWVLVTCIVVILVFLVGNVGFFNGLSDTFKKSRQSPAIP